jgi:sulfite reductase (NADPH) flavoprotein alpha-component
MSKPLLILYATVTGNAESCAESIAETSRQRGFEPRVWSVEGYDVRLLANESAVLFCVSTYGEGDPPDMATEFWEDLQKLPAGALRGMNHAIYALGDSTYTDFCGFGKKLDAELSAKGAECFAERADNDLDFEAGLDQWCSAVFAGLPNLGASIST